MRFCKEIVKTDYTGLHGNVWWRLISFEKIFKKAKAEHSRGRQTRFLSSAINTGLNLAQKYYELITQNPVYATAMILNPKQKWNYFEAKWI